MDDVRNDVRNDGRQTLRNHIRNGLNQSILHIDEAIESLNLAASLAGPGPPKSDLRDYEQLMTFKRTLLESIADIDDLMSGGMHGY